MSWGKGIVVVFIVFFLGIGVMVYRSMTRNIDLVTNNYYEKELKYQEQIDKINRTNSLEEGVKVEFNGREIIINYPAGRKDVTGEISFYKPSDAKSDFKINIEPTAEMKQVLSTDNLHKGLWKVQINWAMDGKDYFNEEKIMIQ
ncbi:MAG TPA: FixH family protein [Ignavibacteria bacterium]|nr:FixH family protein [Ignavibacteria bacterium]HRF67365.1 FixH family protein [Ignavibacteria bacterium]HRJ03063.1 FixH family protein [Ignavibacteria bacterium]HRJ84726.1 FixH family protein [Ignavibacteria bacterium]